MKLPKSFFDAETQRLTGNSRNFLKDFMKQQALTGFNDLVGLSLDPTKPCPRPIPGYQGLDSRLGQWGGPPWPEPAVYSGAIHSGSRWYPAPDDNGPWPWPWGPLIRDLLVEKMFERINLASVRNGSYDFYEVVKRENLAKEALQELNEQLSGAQKEIAIRLKKLG